MAKTLFVSSEIQVALLKQVFIPELMDGFWKEHRPAGHGEIWRDVEVKVTKDGTLGPVGFSFARTYNFLNPAFAVPQYDNLVNVARSIKDSATLKSVKKELTELSRIIGGRQTDRDASPVKLFRGNHREGTVTVSSAAARAAGATLAAAAAQTVTPAKPSVKKTTVKKSVAAAKDPAPTTTAVKPAAKKAVKAKAATVPAKKAVIKTDAAKKTTTKRVAVTA